ncbi:hypothetical protein E2C01_078497 [Portunus trituberculatus]|uniref:Uncharacterized protein n=1 Tax=Portunus trituberculatus TaxID=210409 RepID=A0A5B7IEG5_PORTR|nr:hypothetical protein [Portunus trituberculatus]
MPLYRISTTSTTSTFTASITSNTSTKSTTCKSRIISPAGVLLAVRLVLFIDRAGLPLALMF